MLRCDSRLLVRLALRTALSSAALAVVVTAAVAGDTSAPPLPTAAAADPSAGVAAEGALGANDPQAEARAKAEKNQEMRNAMRAEKRAKVEARLAARRADAEAAGAGGAGEASTEKNRALAKEGEKWDVNQDGTLDAAEKATLQKDMLARWDANGDGHLDADERNAARAAGALPQGRMADVRAAALKRRAEASKAQLEKYDADHDGDVTKEEIAIGVNKPSADRAAEQRRQTLERYDANRDGVLDKDERARAYRENGLLRRDEIDEILAK